MRGVLKPNQTSIQPASATASSSLWRIAGEFKPHKADAGVMTDAILDHYDRGVGVVYGNVGWLLLWVYSHGYREQLRVGTTAHAAMKSM